MAPVFEPRLGRFLAILAGTNLLGPGDVLEAGANDGRAAGELSELLKPRKVLAIEPLIVNAEKAKAIAKDHANMEVLRAGLGATDGQSAYGSEVEKMGAGEYSQMGRYSMYQERERRSTQWIPFTVYAIDTLFRTRRLAFAHLDLEGWEEAALRGARRTLQRDRPLLTVESFPFSQSQMHRNLTRTVKELGYSMHVINESCGWPRDCHNYICVPRERAPAFEPLLASISEPPTRGYRPHQRHGASSLEAASPASSSQHTSTAAAQHAGAASGANGAARHAPPTTTHHAPDVPPLPLPSLERPRLLLTFFTAEIIEFVRNWLCAAAAHIELANTAVALVAMEEGLCAAVQEWLAFDATAAPAAAHSSIHAPSTGHARGLHAAGGRRLRMHATCIELPQHWWTSTALGALPPSAVTSELQPEGAGTSSGGGAGAADAAHGTVYGSTRYLAATHRKLPLLVASARYAKLHGLERVLYLDADTVLHAEPFGALASHEATERAHGREPELLFDRTLGASPECEPALPHNTSLEESLGAGEFNTGVISIRPTGAAVGVLERALGNKIANRTFGDNTDLGALQHVYAHSYGAHRRMGLLPCPLFADGKALGQLHAVHHKLHVGGAAEPMVLYHSNYMLTSGLKKACLDYSGQWVVRPLPMRCAVFNPHKRVAVKEQRYESGFFLIDNCSEASL